MQKLEPREVKTLARATESLTRVPWLQAMSIYNLGADASWIRKRGRSLPLAGDVIMQLLGKLQGNLLEVFEQCLPKCPACTHQQFPSLPRDPNVL